MPNTHIYTLRVLFDKRQLEVLIKVRIDISFGRSSLMDLQAGYSVCIAKQVNGKYDVVWSSQMCFKFMKLACAFNYG